MKWIKIAGESSVLICLDDVQAIAHNGQCLTVRRPRATP